MDCICCGGGLTCIVKLGYCSYALLRCSCKNCSYYWGGLGLHCGTVVWFMGVVVRLMFELHPLLGWLGHYRGIVALLRSIAAWFMGTRYMLLLRFVLALLYCCLVQVYGGCCCGGWLNVIFAFNCCASSYASVLWGGLGTHNRPTGEVKGGLMTCMYVGGGEAGVA